MLCYVDHHDDAYQWAERRKLETHPTTGAAQFVEVRETVQEVVTQVYVAGEPEPVSKPLVLGGIPDEQLLKYGVPPLFRQRVDTLASLLLIGARHLASLPRADHVHASQSQGVPFATLHRNPLNETLASRAFDAQVQSVTIGVEPGRLQFPDALSG